MGELLWVVCAGEDEVDVGQGEHGVVEGGEAWGFYSGVL